MANDTQETGVGGGDRAVHGVERRREVHGPNATDHPGARRVDTTRSGVPLAPGPGGWRQPFLHRGAAMTSMLSLRAQHRRCSICAGRWWVRTCRFPALDGRWVSHVSLDNAASTPAFRFVAETVQRFLPYYAACTVAPATSRGSAPTCTSRHAPGWASSSGPTPIATSSCSARTRRRPSTDWRDR